MAGGKKILGFGLALLAAWGLLLGQPLHSAQAHAGYDHSDPPANSSLASGKAPGQVEVWFTEEVEAKFTEITVVDKNGTRIDDGQTHSGSKDGKSVIVGLKPNLPDGPYTVVYKNISAEDGHVVKGSFAFVVGAGALPANVASVSPIDLAIENQDSNADNLSFLSVTLRWLNYLAGAALVGALAYTLLVWRPAVTRARATGKLGPQLNQAYAGGLRRAQLVVLLGLIGLALGWLGWTIYETASFSDQGYRQLFGVGQGYGPKAFVDFLFSSHYGKIWLIRLALIGLAGLVWWLARTGFPRRFSARTPGLTANLLPAEDTPALAAQVAPATSNGDTTLTAFENGYWFWWVTLGLGALVLLTSSLNSHASAVSNWAALVIGCDWLHLLATSVWVGGLLAMAAGLAVAIPALLPGSGDRTRLLAVVIPAFSQVAIVSVMILIVSGTIQAAIHLSDITDLFSTTYGISLSVKIGLLVPLLLLAAYNLLVVSPRMRQFAKSKKAGPKEGAGSVEAGALNLKFRRSVMAEAVLAIIILGAAGFLTSSAPPNSQAASKVLYFDSAQPGLKVEFAISPAQVGKNTFEARLTDSASGQPVSNARLVELRLTMLDMDMGNPQLELKPTPIEEGRYIAQGDLLSMTGNWQATLIVQRDGHDDINVPVKFKIK